MDIFGQALSDYYYRHAPETLWLHNTYGEPEEMPVDVFFRSEEEMPELELLALEQCQGKVLDIGSGVGSHALLLQEEDLDVTALEICKDACGIMKHRGIKKIMNTDIFTLSGSRFDTLLLLMNGIGLCGDVKRLTLLLQHFRRLLSPGAKILFDSSDISYLYENEERPEQKYLGEVSYQYEYKDVRGPWFNWLYIDANTMSKIAAREGYHFRLLYDDGQDQYLACLET
ncbi:class I SAM-dependent methyltransferase [Arcticibacter sp. MXS-1]|uniref:class I SAM-dependent methyltransferase n=1 Tax=Arcticibacter sp. MXS-1 TaxID=3341726 RepID=UPI0035A9A4F9